MSAEIAPCSRCGNHRVVNPRPNFDIVICENCSYSLGQESALGDLHAAIRALDEIQTDDCEGAHSDADDVLLTLVGPEVAAAYARVVSRCSWWAYA